MKKYTPIHPTENLWREPTGKKLEIQDVEKPKLFRDLFPYTEVPRIPFDGVSIPIDPAQP